MPNTPINDYVLVDDLSGNEFDPASGKVRLKFDPASPVTLKSDSAAGMVFDLAPGALAAATTVSNAVTGSGANQAIVTTVNGKSSAAVLVPDTIGVKPTATAFDGATGILTTTLSDGSVLTANIGITPVDQFLDTVTYVASTATLKLTMSNGSVKNVPLSDLVKVTTDLGVTGDGTTATPVILKLDPASTSGVVSTSSAGLKVIIPTVTPALTTVSNAIAAGQLTTTVNGVNAVPVVLPPATVSTSAPLSGNGSTASPLTMTIDPATSGAAVTTSASGLKVVVPAVAPTTVTLAVAGSGATRSIAPVVNGATGTAVAIPDLDAQTISLTGQVLAISSGNSVTFPPATVATTAPMTGDGSVSNPIKWLLDPATSGISVSQSAAGVKYTVAPPTTAALGISADFNSLSILGSNSVFIQPYSGGTTSTAKVTITSPQRGVTADVIVDPVVSNILTTGTAGLVAKVLTAAPLSGSGNAASPLTMAIDPASTPGVVSTSSAGLKVVVPSATPVTNTLAITQAGGAVSTVSGVAATQAIPTGVIAQNLGFDVAGKAVFAPAITTEIHQLTAGDFPNFAIFNGRTYPVAQWTPFMIGETWQFSGAAQLQRHQSQWSVNAAGNWTIQFDLAGNTAINETWPAIQVGFMRIAPTRFGGI